MYLITTKYQKSRSHRNPDKPGCVVFKINCKEEDGSEWIERTIYSDIYGDKDTVIDANRDEIVRFMRLIYCVIEQYHDSAKPFTIDDVVDEIRRVAGSEEEKGRYSDRISKDFPLRGDIVSVGNKFKRDFSFIYQAKEPKSNNLLEYILFLSKQARNEGKSSMVRSYNSTGNSLSKFLNNADISLKDINRSFLSDYAAWLDSNGVSESTQSFYLRTLRSVINKAKDDGLVTLKDSLFKGLNTRVIFTYRRENPKILSHDDLLRISRLSFPDNPEGELVRDMFMFGFYCRGMELIDVLNLKRSNIKDDILCYHRRSKGAPVNIRLERSAGEIINKYQSSGSSYIFPLRDIYKGLQQYSICNIVRRNLKQIGSTLGIPDLTFSMNIAAWQQLVLKLNVSDILLKSV